MAITRIRPPKLWRYRDGDAIVCVHVLVLSEPEHASGEYLHATRVNSAGELVSPTVPFHPQSRFFVPRIHSVVRFPCTYGEALPCYAVSEGQSWFRGYYRETMVIDLTSDFGKRVERRLQSEQIIWLVTTGADGTPQPSPVWFLYHDENVLLYSEPNTPKVRNIARNPHVALHFNSDAHGNDVMVITGTAQVLPDALPADAQAAYVAKYAEGIKSIKLTPESMVAKYSAVIRITPEKMRGF